MAKKNSILVTNSANLANVFNDVYAQKIIAYLDSGKWSPMFPHHERILERLFRGSGNADFDAVLLECTVLNDFYSTRISSNELFELAKFIVKNYKIIDTWLLNGDWQVVDFIRTAPNCRNNYSFATKFANWHNHLDFPIYDRRVRDLLVDLMKLGINLGFKHAADLSDYVTFVNALINLVKHFNLKFCINNNARYSNINFKLLDKFLWALSNFVFYNNISANIPLGKQTINTGNYTITRGNNGGIIVVDNATGKPVKNVRGWLRDKHKELGLPYEEKWNTRQFGRNLLEFLSNVIEQQLINE